MFLLILFIGVAYIIKDWSGTIPFLQQPDYKAGDKLFSEDGRPLGIGKRYPEDFKYFDFNACKEIGEKYAAEVLDDFYKLEQQGFIYRPWVQFANPPFIGKRVTVEVGKLSKPRRKTINPKTNSKLPVVYIFTFGGSTTFGYWVSDEHTWPTFLSQLLNERAEKERKPFRIEVLNYGRNAYTSSQETALLIDILRSGRRASLAIFLEGVNWGGVKDVPGFTKQAEKLFLAGQFYEAFEVQASHYKYEWLPVIQLISSIINRFENYKREINDRAIRPHNLQAENNSDMEKQMSLVTNRFKQNKKLIKLIASGYNLKTLFFLQPNVYCGYNLDLLRYDLRKELDDVESTAILYNNLRKDKGYIDLSNLFKLYGEDKKALIDCVHYSPAFNKFLAEQIARHIDLNQLKPFSHIIDESQSTGRPYESLTFGMM